MGLIRLKPPEQELFKDVEHGNRTHFDAAASGRSRTIRAEVLRHIVLGLPLAKRGIIRRRKSGVCQTTGAGVSLTNAIVDGPVELAAAIGFHGGPLCPLEFRNCTFTGYFSGATAHFSHLSFTACCFVDRGEHLDAQAEAIRPTINLMGAKIDRQLDMEGIRPAPGQDSLLWIQAAGVSVGGGVNLAKSFMRAPHIKACPTIAPPVLARTPPDALDLTLAKIDGDLSLDNGAEVHGRVKLRGTRIRGDMWLDAAKLRHHPDKEREALMMQGAYVGGFLALRAAELDPSANFHCVGDMDLVAAEVRRSLIVKDAEIEGDVTAQDLVVRDDFYLRATVKGRVDFVRLATGGCLDISHLQMKGVYSCDDAKASLDIRDGKIGGTLRLAGKPGDQPPRLRGLVDLTGLTCDMLDDDLGQGWGSNVRILMNHFTYRRAAWLSGHAAQRRGMQARKGSHRIVGDWLLSRRADGQWPWRWLPRIVLPKSVNFWEPWQLRRNWIYQQYRSYQTRLARSDPYRSMARHRVRENDYHPQPFEQAIKVARAEGREDFATHFEIQKQRLEWKLFNRRLRWGLALVAITLSSFWLALSTSESARWGIVAGGYFLTVAAMIFASALRSWFSRRVVLPLLRRQKLSIGLVLLLVGVSWILLEESPKALAVAIPGLFVAVGLTVLGALFAARIVAPQGRVARAKWAVDGASRLLTWAAYWMPALALAMLWIRTPFPFLVALSIFLAIRLLAVLAHQLMRFGFGYLRRPVFAVTTLVAAFMIGWWGVHVANSRNMFVVALTPTAGTLARFAVSPPRGGTPEIVYLPGIERTTDRSDYEIPCSQEISEPLYALDVMIPIVDLGEESRCEVRRFAARDRPVVHPENESLADLWRSRGDFPLNDHRFWWWMKAFYAIAGWILVSLALLTFAQVNRTRGEAAEQSAG